MNAGFEASTTSGGSYTPIAATEITQISTGSTNLVLVELKAETIAGLGVGPFLKFYITVGTAASLVSAVVLASYSYLPSSAAGAALTPAQTVVD